MTTLPEQSKEELKLLLSDLVTASREAGCVCESIDVELYASRDSNKEGGLRLQIAPVPIGINAKAELTIGQYSRIKATFTPLLSDEERDELFLRANAQKKAAGK